MFKKKEQTRLGDILISKGLITQEQLASAIQEQSRRKRLLDPADTTATVAPLGEILIEMGFIDRMQLKRGLNWQQRLRHASIAMALCAPFMMFIPSVARAAPAPITIEAENYSTMNGVQTESTSDIGGGKNVGYIDAGDSMTYKGISVAVAGTYKVTFRMASQSGGGSFQLKSADGKVLDTVTVPATGGWQNWVDIERTVSLEAGSNDLTLLALSSGFNINWMKLDLVSATAAPVTVPTITIRAENYSTMSGVQTESTSDIGGGKNVGYIDAGDSMTYKGISVAVAGTYKVTFRVASQSGGGSFQLKSADGKVLDTVTVPATGGWQNWVDIERTVSLEAGSNDLTLLALSSGFNINWMKLDLVAPVTAPTVTIQSEDYSAMSGIQTETTSDTGGGKNVGYIDAGDWMEYKNVEVLIPTTANYKITYRVASLSAGGSFTFNEAGGSAVYDTVPVPVTGGWQKWTSVERIVTLPAGKHSFGVKALLGGFNVNWIKIEPADGASTPVLPPATGNSSSSSSSSKSSTAVSSSSSSKPSTAVSSSWSSSSAANHAEHVAGPVGITWTAPNARENGDFLDITELGGYEIRYKKASDSTFTYISIEDAWTTSYQFPWLEGDYVFQIAAFDKNGVYSPFVDIQRQ